MTLTVYTIYLVILSSIAFAAYVADKKKAKKGKWRTPEATLLLLSLFGGAIGGYLAMHIVRHKTKKWYFHLVNLIGMIWQLAALVYFIGDPDIFF